MLANWLLWTAVGSSLIGRLAAYFAHPRRLVAGLQVVVAVVFPLTIFAVRASRSVFQTTPGELLGPWPMSFTSLVTLSAFCEVSGFLFAAGSRLYAHQTGSPLAAGTASLYLLEAAGSGVGGILASLVLIRYLVAFAIAFVVSLLNVLAAARTRLAGVPRLYPEALVGRNGTLGQKNGAERLSNLWCINGLQKVSH